MDYFPKPYPGELFYSILARYQVHTNQRKSFPVIKQLLNRDKIHENFLFPSHIATLSSNISEVIDINNETLINNHTFFPFLVKFLPHEKVDHILDQLLHGGSRRNLNPIAEFDANCLRHCPICILEEKDRFGEAYWKLVHNLPLVTSCYTHHCDLNQFRPIFKGDKIFYSADGFMIEDMMAISYSKPNSFLAREVLNIFMNHGDFYFPRMINVGIKKGFIYKMSANYFRSSIDFGPDFSRYVASIGQTGAISHLHIRRVIHETLNQSQFRIYLSLCILLNKFFKL